MNLNDFVVFPNKPKSVKLNVRNLRELRMETVHLDQENKDLENRLKELREIMSREKEEREKSGALRWKSAQANSGTRSKEKGVKLPAGKMKIRVLKDESLPEVHRLPERVPGPPPRDAGHSRKPRLKGKVCGQCEARMAGLVCAECGEDYCVGCFARFHQKGALKHHRMIPIQVELQTSVSSLDVLSRFHKQIGEESEVPSQSTHGTAVSSNAARTQPTYTPVGYQDTHSAQVLLVNEDEEVEDDEDEGSLLSGHFDEEASSRSFQEAVNEWRERKQAGGTADEEEPHHSHRRVPVTVEVIGTQAGETSQQPIRVEFREHSLSYMERLLLKKHRRTPIESYCPLPALSSTPQDLLARSPTQPAEELTAEEMDLHEYCVSLFALSSPAGREQPDETPKSCPSITEIDEAVGDSAAFGPSGVKQGDDKRKLNQGSEDSFTTLEDEEVPWPTKPPITSHSSPLFPLGGLPNQSPEPFPTSPSSSLKSPKLRVPNSLKLSADQEVERKLQRTQSPRLSYLPKPPTARGSAPPTPKFTFTETAPRSSPMFYESGWSQGHPGARNRDAFLLPPTNCPSPVFSLSSGSKLRPVSPDGLYLNSDMTTSSSSPLIHTSYSPTSSPRPVELECFSHPPPAGLKPKSDSSRPGSVVFKSTLHSPTTSPRPVALTPTSHSPNTSPRPVALTPTSHSPNTSPRPVALTPTSHSPTTSPRPVALTPTSHSPNTIPRPVALTPTLHSPTTSPRPAVLKSTSHSPTTSPRPVALTPTSHSPTTSPRPVALTPTSHSPTTIPRPVALTPTLHSPTTSPRPAVLKSTSHSPTTSPRPVMLKSTADYPPVAFKSNSDPPTTSPKPIVLKSTSHSESLSPRTEFLKTPSHSLTTSPRPVMLKSTAGSRPTILTSTSHSESSSPRPQVLKTPSRSLSTSPGPPPSYSPTTSPSPSNSLPQCISALPQEASFALPAEATLSLRSLEVDSLTLPVYFHPFPDSPRSTDVHRSPPPPSSPPSLLLGLSDSDSLSDSLDLIPGDEDSSDEEMRECADREQEEEEQGGRSSASLQPPLSPGGDAPLSLLDSLQESPPPSLFTEPSQALISLAQRQTSESQQYQGLEGFLTLGLDPNCVQSSPTPPHIHVERHSYSKELTTGQGSWRPASSLRRYAEEEVVAAVINNQPVSNSSRSATPMGSVTMLRRPDLPGFSRPNTADPAKTPLFRSLSCAALEIQEVQSVEQPELIDSEDEDDEDDQALAGLEEELRRMSAEPCDQEWTNKKIRNMDRQ